MDRCCKKEKKRIGWVMSGTSDLTLEINIRKKDRIEK